MATQPFKTNFSAITNRVVLVWYLDSNQSAEVGRTTLPFPNISGQVTTVTGLSTQAYIFRWYESSNGTTLDSLIMEWAMDVKGTANVVEMFYYTVGGAEHYDPEPDQTILADTRLEGKTFHVSNRGTSWRKPTDYEPIINGGFQLLTGETFTLDDEWVVMAVTPAETQQVTGGSDYQDIYVVTGSSDFSNDQVSKNNIAQSSGNITTTFGLFSGIADARARFSTYAFAGRYWTLQFATGNTVSFLGEDVNSITLRQDEVIELMFKGGVCHVTYYSGKAEIAGEYLLANKKLRGTEYADGTEHDIADFQPLIDSLPSALIVTYADWDLTQTVTIGEDARGYFKNRGKFAVDTVAGKFKFPDLRDFSFKALKLNDGTTDETNMSQGIGGMQAAMVGTHQHELSIWADDASTAFATKTVTARRVEDFTQAVNNKTTVHLTKAVGSTENTVKTIRQFALVRI